MATQGNLLRGLLTKRPFYRTSPQSLGISGQEITNTAESSVTADKVIRTIVTQADFIRELDTDSHAINNKELGLNIEAGTLLKLHKLLKEWSIKEKKKKHSAFIDIYQITSLSPDEDLKTSRLAE